MKNMTPIRIAQLCDGIYYGDDALGEKELSSIVTDNRQVIEEGMFIAIKGAKVDGNRFVPAAYEAGALCCMSEDAPADPAKPYIQVKDCLQAIQKIAAYYRQVNTAKVIGITGSVGKTTTKEMLASVLSVHYTTLKTLGNFNNELGLPLTLFRLRPEHEIAIVEMGISDFGEMSRLTQIAKPDLCVITNIGQCHLEQLHDRDGVLRAKTEIFEGLNTEGTAYLNGDDDKLQTITQVHGKLPVFFGIGENNAVHPVKITSRGLAGTDLVVQTPQGMLEVHVPVPGRHMVTNALAATAIGLDLGLTGEEIAKGIEQFRPVDGHGSVYTTDKFTIMDDCYNANPVSMKAGLDLLAEVPERKVAVIGDMFELGENEQRLHFEVGAYAAKSAIDVYVCAGTLAKQYVAGLQEGQTKAEIHAFDTMEEAADALAQIVRPSDAILVKASHGMHFEKIVASLKEM